MPSRLAGCQYHVALPPSPVSLIAAVHWGRVQGHSSAFIWWWWLMAFSSLARILGECSTIHSPLVLFFLSFFVVVVVVFVCVCVLK